MKNLVIFITKGLNQNLYLNKMPKFSIFILKTLFTIDKYCLIGVDLPFIYEKFKFYSVLYTNFNLIKNFV